MKNSKKIIAYLLTLVMLMSSMSAFSAFAEDKSQQAYTAVDGEGRLVYVNTSTQKQSVNESENSEQPIFVSGGQYSFDGGAGSEQKQKDEFNFNSFDYLRGAFNFGSQLTGLEKNVYDNIVTALKNDVSTEVVLFTPTATLTGNSLPDLGDKVLTSVATAIFAVCHDYPEFFWIDGFSYNFSYYENPIRVSQVEVDIIFSDAFTPLNVEDYYNRLMSAVNSFSISGADRYEKLLSIHDALADLITYDENIDNPILANKYSRTPVGALLDSHIAVCEGYAESFKLLCDRLGIPCILVIGDDHMWNYVQMDDGNWYMVDVTWDDQETITLHDYFLCGRGTILPNFGETCDYGHGESFDFITGIDITALSYPTLHIGNYVHSSTGQEPSSKLLGDVNLDNKVSIVDARWILQYTIGSIKFNEQQKTNADYNSDGKINITDARHILQYSVSA